MDEINAEGGIQIEWNMEDDENDPEKAVSAYNNLKDWGMQLSLGSVTSKPGEATATENYADRIFALTPSASSTAVTEGKDNVFQMCFTDPNQGTASADYIADNQLGTKIAVIYKNDDVYSSGIFEKFQAEADAKGPEHCVGHHLHLFECDRLLGPAERGQERWRRPCLPADLLSAGFADPAAGQEHGLCAQVLRR